MANKYSEKIDVFMVRDPHGRQYSAYTMQEFTKWSSSDTSGVATGKKNHFCVIKGETYTILAQGKGKYITTDRPEEIRLVRA